MLVYVVVIRSSFLIRTFFYKSVQAEINQKLRVSYERLLVFLYQRENLTHGIRESRTINLIPHHNKQCTLIGFLVMPVFTY